MSHGENRAMLPGWAALLCAIVGLVVVATVYLTIMVSNIFILV